MKSLASGIDALVWRLEALGDADLTSSAVALISNTEVTLAVGADRVAAVLESRIASHEQLAVATALEAHGGSLALLVAARLFVRAERYDQARDCLTRAVTMSPCPDPDLLLERARLWVQSGDADSAAQDLRSALKTWPSFTFYSRCERLIDKVMAAGGGHFRRHCRLALVGSSTTTLLATTLKVAAFRDQIELLVYEGPHGAFRQEILEPSSALHAFAPDVVVILVSHHDLSLPPTGAEARALDLARDLRQLWATLKGRAACHVVQVALDLPAAGAWGELEDLPDGRRHALSAANRLLTDDLPAGVSILDPGSVQSEVGAAYADLESWLKNRQYPAPSALPLFADQIMAQVRALLGLASKVVVCDLDNTLWGGVIGEEGVGGIRIGPPSASGEAFAALQRYLQELKARGVLLAVSSKNNLADAELPFREHDAMLLRLDDFVAFRANWQDKAANLRAIAAELALGLESFVFLDDNPLERAWVRRELPEVQVPECGHGPLDMLAALNRGRYFETLEVTAEDRARHGSYKANAQRQEVARAGGSLEDFLRSLDMRAEHGAVGSATLSRVAQLVNKTNQFNLTTRRYTEAQLEAMAGSPAWWCHWFRLRDKFGDHGLVGVVLAARGDSDWEVDTFLMSCRVLGRQMEQFMCRSLVEAARSTGARGIRGLYLPTAKNALVKDLYPTLGFVTRTQDFYLELGPNEPRPCPFIRDAGAGT